MLISVYIHLPFCLKKCPYCDFVSYADPSISRAAYCDMVLKELEFFAGIFPRKPSVRSLYLGGGTPSLFEPALLEKIIQGVRTNFGLLENAEVTIEINPGSIDRRKMRAVLKEYLAMGINRTSIGIQSTRNDILERLGRIHRSHEGKFTYDCARSAGFSNISLDLIFGIYGQNCEEWLGDLAEAVSWGPEHISAYMLKAPPEWQPAEEEIVCDMYLSAVEVLEKAGLYQYEVSNFARTGKKCVHNFVYWCRESYLGIGAGAHSFLSSQLMRDAGFAGAEILFGITDSGGGVRFSNETDLSFYAEKTARDGNSIANVEKLTEEQELHEKIMLGLRLKEGIVLSQISPYLEKNGKNLIDEMIIQMKKDGLCEDDPKRLKLTPRGFLLADEISARITALLKGSSNLTSQRK